MTRNTSKECRSLGFLLVGKYTGNKMPPKVSIIILNWNQPEFTINCVKSVLKQDYNDFEILLVDNGSDDNSLEIFEKEFSENKKIRILETGKNLGYAGGNNFGVENAKGDYITILNNDTIVEENWLSELVKGLESEEKTGAVSSWEIREGVEDRVDTKSLGFTNTLLGYQVTYHYKKSLEKTDIINLLPIDGCSFIYKKNIIDQPFDSEYFIYAEEIYLAWLLNLKGYKNKLATKSIVHHFHNIAKKSNRKINRYFVYLGERNRLMNFILFYELKNLIKVLPLAFLGILILNLSEPTKMPHRIKSYIWLLCHPIKIMKKREHIQKQRLISDEKIIKKMSYKFIDESKVEKIYLQNILGIINKFFRLYCKLVGLNTVDI